MKEAGHSDRPAREIGTGKTESPATTNDPATTAFHRPPVVEGFWASREAREGGEGENHLLSQ